MFAFGNYAYLVNGPSIERVRDLIINHIDGQLKANQTIQPQDAVLAQAMEEGVLRVFGVCPKLIGCIPCFSTLCDQHMDYGTVLEQDWSFAKASL